MSLLSISLPPRSEQSFLKMLAKKSKTATHVNIHFTTCVDTYLIILGEDEAFDFEDFLEDENSFYGGQEIVEWFGKIAGNLPKLTHVSIYSDNISYCDGLPPSVNACRFPVAALGELLKGSSAPLENLTFGYTNYFESFTPEIFGTRQDYEQTLTRLTELENFQTFIVNTDSWTALDTEVDPKRMLCTALARSESLKKVTLDSTFNTDTCVQFLQAIETNETMKEIGLVLDRDPNDISQLEQAIQNLGYLQTLDLQNCSDSKLPVALACLRGLGKNKSLVSVSCVFGLDVTADAINDAVESALESNTTLTELTLKNTCPSRNHYGRVGGGLISISPKASFFLTTNRVGRKALLEHQDDHDRWIKSLIDEKDDCQITFWLLSTNISAYIPSMLKSSEPADDKMEATHVQKKPKHKH